VQETTFVIIQPSTYCQGKLTSDASELENFQINVQMQYESDRKFCLKLAVGESAGNNVNITGFMASSH